MNSGRQTLGTKTSQVYDKDENKREPVSNRRKSTESWIRKSYPEIPAPSCPAEGQGAGLPVAEDPTGREEEDAVGWRVLWGPRQEHNTEVINFRHAILSQDKMLQDFLLVYWLVCLWLYIRRSSPR